MKKSNYIVLFTLLFMGVALSSCFEDTSSLDLDPITGVEIDTTGMTELSVFQFENLVVEPNLETGDLSESDLSYEWRINIEPNDTLYTVIGEERNLDYEVTFKPNRSDQAHQVYYSVFDNSTGIEYIMTWPLTVKNNISEGLVIAETSDGANTDISHIMAPEVTPDYTETSVKHNIYSAINGTTIPGLVKQMRFTQIYGVDAILGITNNSVIRINTLDYTPGGTNDDLFYSSTSNYEPQALGAIVQGDMYVGNGRLTGTYLGASREFGLPFDFSFEVPNHVGFNAFTYYPLPVRIHFYDEVNQHFVYLPSISAWGDSNMYAPPSVADTDFNPGDLPNKKNLAAGVSTEGDFRHLLQDKETGNISLHVLDGGQSDSPVAPAPKDLIDLSNAPEISQATHFLLLDDQKVMFYSTPGKIYAMLYSSSEPVFEERYTVPGGEEITTLQVYQQSDYPFRSGGEFSSTNNRQLIMSTFDGNQGRVSILPFVNTGLANIDEPNIKTYEGFGRITAISTQL